jgi:hypothetical protein
MPDSRMIKDLPCTEGIVSPAAVAAMVELRAVLFLPAVDEKRQPFLLIDGVGLGPTPLLLSFMRK